MASAQVTAQVVGGESKVWSLEDAPTVGDVKRLMGVPNYTATVNGEPEDDDYELAEWEFVTLSPPVKGG